ncbi:MAG: sulfite exporter TauE/SafE family protein [Acidimicrobiales bacterium]
MPLRALITSPLGFLIGLSLGALGGGGSILAVPALVYAAGQDPREATASSLLLVGAAAAVGIGPHWRAGRVRLDTGVAFGGAGIGGSLVGSALNRRIDPDVLLLAFAVLALVAARRMLTGCPSCTRAGEERAVHTAGVAGVAVVTRIDIRRGAAVVAAGIGVGLLTGLFGVGGGFVIVPALTLLLHLSMPAAIGTSLVVIVINCAVALAARMPTASIDWAVTIPFAVAATSGAITGGRLADQLDARRSLRWFAALLVGVAAYTAVDALTG